MKEHFYHNILATSCTVCAMCRYCIVPSCVMCCKLHILFKLLLAYHAVWVIDCVCTTASAFSPTCVSCYIVFFVCCIVLSVYVLWIVILCCIFGDVLYTVNVVQELFKSGIVCLILCILSISYYHVFLHCMVWALHTVSTGCCVSKLCTVDISPVLCLHYCQPSVPCVLRIISTLLPAQCVTCVSPFCISTTASALWWVC